MNKIDPFYNEILFLPDATRGTIRSVTNSQIKDTGTKAIVVNTLHLLISPGPQLIHEAGGIHKFMNWDGIILSDSGGFQVFSLLHTGKWKGGINDNGAIFKSPRDGTIYELTPEGSIDIQMQLGTDVMVVLDDCRKAETSREEAEVSVKNTLKWAERCKKHYLDNFSPQQREGKLLSAVVQGANFTDLREFCAKELVDIGFNGYNFGGYLLDDKGDLVTDQLKSVADSTPSNKFNYAMGAGKPEDIFECAKLGYTIFDTVLPTRNARHGTLYVSSVDGGVLRIKNSQYRNDSTPVDTRCDCELCTNHTRSYLYHLINNSEMTGMSLATIHNLRFYQRLINFLNENRSEIVNMSYDDALKRL